MTALLPSTMMSWMSIESILPDCSKNQEANFRELRSPERNGLETYRNYLFGEISFVFDDRLLAFLKFAPRSDMAIIKLIVDDPPSSADQPLPELHYPRSTFREWEA